MITLAPDRPANDVTVAKIFFDVLWHVVKVWCAALLIAVFVSAWRSSSENPLPAIAISLGSGLVSILALIPGCRLHHSAILAEGVGRSKSLAMRSHLVVVGAAAAMAIRFVGTIALFVVCRYLFGLPSEALAVHVGLWYGLLTTVEIFWLARYASAIDSLGISQTPLTDSSVG